MTKGGRLLTFLIGMKQRNQYPYVAGGTGYKYFPVATFPAIRCRPSSWKPRHSARLQFSQFFRKGVFQTNFSKIYAPESLVLFEKGCFQHISLGASGYDPQEGGKKLADNPITILRTPPAPPPTPPASRLPAPPARSDYSVTYPWQQYFIFAFFLKRRFRHICSVCPRTFLQRSHPIYTRPQKGRWKVLKTNSLFGFPPTSTLSLRRDDSPRTVKVYIRRS